MPPKRKVPARRASTGKKVSIGDSIVIPMPAATLPGHPRRYTAVEVDYKSTPSLASNEPPKKLAKSSQDASTPKAAHIAAVDNPKRRGRPPKNAATATVATSLKRDATTTTSTPVKAARGRPKMTETVEASPILKSPKRKRDEDEPEAAPPKKRGRPAKADTTPVKAPAPQKRGRPRSDGVPAKKSRKSLVAKVQKDKPKNGPAAKSKTVAEPKAAAKTTARPAVKRGRPAGSTNKPKTVTKKANPTKKAAKAKTPNDTTESEAEDFVEGLTQDDKQDDLDLQYWLMKAEPNTRIEKGIDVGYPIDKLAQAIEPEPWDGVRSPVARNNMRAMRKGDLAFFYHSNCDNPGIVGVMRVVEEHAVDESAFDPAHPYFDEKSDRSKPKWDCVKVEFVKKFNEIITLKVLKSTPELSDMQVAQKAFSRLSVQKVTPAQWQFVLKMANEPEDLGVISPVSGYEADTNGETDKEAVDESVGVHNFDPENLATYRGPGDAEEGVVDDDATKLTAHDSPEDAPKDVIEDEDIPNIQPKTNGFAASARGYEPNRTDDLDRDETRFSGDYALGDNN